MGWIYEEGLTATAEVFEEKTKLLEKLFAPIALRVEEIRRRPEAKEDLEKAINTSSNFLAKGRESDLLPAQELQRLEDLVIETQTWYEKAEEDQEALKPYEDPALRVMDVYDKITALDRE